MITISGLDNTSYTTRTVPASATVPQTLNANDSILIVTGGAVAQAVTIPGASTVIPGRQYSVINGSGGSTTITAGAGTINGAATLVLLTGTSATVVTDGGTNWYILSEGTVA